MPGRVAPRHLADDLISRGKHFVTTEEAAVILGVEPTSVRSSLRRSIEAGAVIAITKDAWIPVPAEYRRLGAPPPSHYIDALMRHLGHPYYVGLLSAAQLHGVAHQAPMAFQIVTPAVMRDRRVGRSQLHFIRRAAAPQRATTTLTVPTGRVVVASPETTLLDLVEAPEEVGGLDNVATVVRDLLDTGSITLERLADAAGHYPTAVVQRAGYLIDLLDPDERLDLADLEHVVAGHSLAVLDPGNRRPGRRDKRWNVLVNADVEPDE